jgi:protein-S-isoprenylcysteine O-methyltransferase Ste14
MRFLHSVTEFVLFFELPIPLYWLMIHPFNSFWRPRVRAAFWFAGLFAWITGGLLLWHFRFDLMESYRPPWSSVIAGFALIFVEVYLFVRVEHELGTRRLVGQAELTGTGEFFAGGLYAHVRHPRYAGMFCAVIGAALLCGTDELWYAIALWFPFALIVIGLEERELVTRFGPSYEAYRTRVPAFIPLGKSTEK